MPQKDYSLAREMFSVPENEYIIHLKPEELEYSNSRAAVVAVDPYFDAPFGPFVVYWYSQNGVLNEKWFQNVDTAIAFADSGIES